MGTQYANITDHGALTVDYLKSMQEKIKISNKIPIEKVEQILCVSFKYVEATRRGPTPAQVWQKLKNIKNLAKKQSQQQATINNKLTILKEQQAATIAFPKLQTWAVVAANAKICFLLYNKNNKIVVKLNDNALAKKIKKQALKEVA